MNEICLWNYFGLLRPNGIIGGYHFMPFDSYATLGKICESGFGFNRLEALEVDVIYRMNGEDASV